MPPPPPLSYHVLLCGGFCAYQKNFRHSKLCDAQVSERRQGPNQNNNNHHQKKFTVLVDENSSTERRSAHYSKEDRVDSVKMSSE